MRLFLDANVLFAACQNPEGRAAALFALAGKGLVDLATSPHAVEEARRNLEADYPHSLRRLDHLRAVAHMVSEADAHSLAWAMEQGLPLKDAPILAAAVDAQVDGLVTGDKAHFGHLFGKTVGGVKVLRLADALNLLL